MTLGNSRPSTDLPVRPTVALRRLTIPPPDDGRRIDLGEWIQRDDGLWALRIARAEI